MAGLWIYWRDVLIVLDLLFIYGAFILAYFVRVVWVFSTDFPFKLFAWLALVGTVVWIGFLVFAKLYRIPPRSGKRAWYDVTLIFLGGIIAVGFLIVTYFFQLDILFSRLIGLYLFVFGIAGLLISQVVFRILLDL